MRKSRYVGLLNFIFLLGLPLVLPRRTKHPFVSKWLLLHVLVLNAICRTIVWVGMVTPKDTGTFLGERVNYVTIPRRLFRSPPYHRGFLCCGGENKSSIEIMAIVCLSIQQGITFGTRNDLHCRFCSSEFN